MNQPLLQMDLRLVGAAIVVLAAAVIAIWMVGRRFRAELGPTRSLADAAAVGGTLGGTPAGASSQVAKVLQARGLVTPAQLARMTEPERKLLFDAMADAISVPKEENPPIRAIDARPVVEVDGRPTLYCPLCSYRIEQFTSVPPITGQCETCGAKVVMRRDGSRLLLTVLPTNAQHNTRI